MPLACSTQSKLGIKFDVIDFTMKKSKTHLVQAALLIGISFFAFITHAQDVDLESTLLQYNVDEPTSDTASILASRAGDMGAQAELEFYSNDELDPGPAIGRDFDSTEFMMDSAGYMKVGMDDQLPLGIIANPYIAQLFQRFNSLRNSDGVSLPADFAPLANFVERYIVSQSDSGTERANGVTNHALAVQIVRASFCFGNDPLMIISKMRRETNFNRTLVSPTGAVGWSQMTGSAIDEVQDQMSGNSRVSMPNARTVFQRAIRCFTGIENFNVPSGTGTQVKERLSNKWGLDMVFGQIMVKTLVSYMKASNNYGNNSGGAVAAYQDAFVAYNGDTSMTRGICTRQKSVQMKVEYGCDVIAHYNRLSAQWTRFARSTDPRRLSWYLKPNLFKYKKS